MKGRVKSGSARTGADVTADLRVVNAVAASSFQENPSFFKSAVRGGRDGAIVVDEFAVIAREAQEPPDRASGTRLRPVGHRLYLRGIHGHAGVGDDVAEVCDGRRPKSTLGALDEQLVLLQHGEHGPEVAEVVDPGRAVDQNVIKKHQDEPAEEGAQDVVHECLESCWGVAQAERHDEELI